MIFRKCGEKDVPLIREILVDSFSNYFFHVNPSEEELKEQLYALNFDADNSLLAYLDNEPIGVAVCGARGDTIHLGPMGIVTKYQGQGYGKELLEKTIELHRGNKFKKILLEVIRQNSRAYHLYRNAGFTVTRKLCGLKSMSRAAAFDKSVKVVKEDPKQILKCFHDFHEDDYLAWHCAYESVEKANPGYGFCAYAGDELAGYAMLKYFRLLDITCKPSASGVAAFEIFKALMSSAFEVSSFIFIYDLLEEDIRVKYFTDMGFEKFFEQYEMIYAT